MDNQMDKVIDLRSRILNKQPVTEEEITEGLEIIRRSRKAATATGKKSKAAPVVVDFAALMGQVAANSTEKK